MGKGAALRHGFAAALEAGANAVLVIDADSVVSPNLIRATRAEAWKRAPRLHSAVMSWSCRPMDSGRPMARLRALAFRGMNVLRARGRAGLGFSTGLFGNGFALTAANTGAACLSAPTALPRTWNTTPSWPVKGCGFTGLEMHSCTRHMAASGAAQATQEATLGGRPVQGGQPRDGAVARAVLQREMARALRRWPMFGAFRFRAAFLHLLLTLMLPLHWLHVLPLVCAAIALLYVLEAALLGTQPMAGSGGAGGCSAVPGVEGGDYAAGAVPVEEPR